MTDYYPTLGFDPAPGDVGVGKNLHGTVSRVAGRLSAANGALRQLGRSDAASEELSRIISQAHGLLVEHDDMASRVAKSLRDAADVAPAKLGLFQRLSSALSESDISTVLGVVATVCMFISPLEAAAGVLFAVSAGFALGALATTGMKNAGAMDKAGLAAHEATGFEAGAEVIGAANFLRYARIAKGSILAGTTGLELGSWNPRFGNTLDDVKKSWNALSGHDSSAALGATFVNGVGGAQTRRSATLAPA